MTKIRLSHSLISLWESGDVQGAIDCYFHVDRVSSRAMENGKRVHEELAEYIKKERAFPEWFFKYELQIPETEKAVVVSYNELCDLKGVFDCLDGDTIFEFKTGNSDSLEWARTNQIPLYFLIAELAGINVSQAILIRNNGTRSDFCVVHNSQKLRDKARNVIDSCVHEIYTYFQDQGLLCEKN